MKNKNLIRITASAFLIALVVFTGCQKEELIRMVGIVQGIAYDGNTNEPLSDVSYAYLLNGETVTDTATVAGYTVTGLPSGEYDFTFSKTGFTTVITSVNVDNYNALNTNTIKGGATEYQTITLNPNLYALDGALTGVVYISMPSGLSAPAVGATVMLDYNDAYIGDNTDIGYARGISPSIYTATTDADGKYSFVDVPATSTYVRVQAFNDGTTTYRETSTSAEVRSGGNAIDALTLYNADSNIDYDFTAPSSTDGNIEIIFNKSIDQATFEVNMYANGSTPIEVNVNWMKALSTVIIDPVGPLTPGMYYSVSFKGKTTDGIEFNNSYGFNAVNGIAFIGSNTLLTSDTWNTIPVEDFDVASDITLSFNMDADQARTELDGYVELTDDNGNAVDAAVSYASNVVTLNPTVDLQAGVDYTIDFDVYSAIIADDGHSESWTFTTASVAAAIPAAITDFALAASYAVGNTFDFDDDFFNFDYTQVIDGEATYEFWAKDSYNNVNFVFLGDVTTNNLNIITKVLNQSVGLPNQFDHFDGNSQTPLSHGTSVTFKMRAINTDGVAGPWSDEVTVTDTEKMGFIGNKSYWGGVDNTLGTSTIEFTVDLSFPEYVDLSQTPSFAIAAGATIVAANFSGAWISNYTYRVSFVVPVGSDFSGDVITASNFVDSSGNVSDVGDNVTITLQ